MSIVIPPSAPTITAQAIINRACDLFGYKDSAESLSAADSANFLLVLNDMVDNWNTQRMFLPAISDVTANVSGLPITVGPGATINIARPIRMEAGAFIRSGGIDYPITWIERLEYDSIASKTQAGTAYSGYYDAAVPIGSIYLYPYPATTVELHLRVLTNLSEFAALATTYTLPPGYRKALEYSLAEELALGKREIPAAIPRIASSARRVIRRVNTRIEPLSFDGATRFNIYSGL